MRNCISTGMLSSCCDDVELPLFDGGSSLEATTSGGSGCDSLSLQPVMVFRSVSGVMSNLGILH